MIEVFGILVVWFFLWPLAGFISLVQVEINFEVVTGYEIAGLIIGFVIACGLQFVWSALLVTWIKGD